MESAGEREGERAGHDGPAAVVVQQGRSGPLGSSGAAVHAGAAGAPAGDVAGRRHARRRRRGGRGRRQARLPQGPRVRRPQQRHHRRHHHHQRRRQWWSSSQHADDLSAISVSYHPLWCPNSPLAYHPRSLLAAFRQCF